MGSSNSLALRAVLAVGLMIGFYLLAIAVAFGLLYLPYAEVVYGNRLHIKLAILCVAGAGIILWSILPRWERFEAPGPKLSEADHPALFKELRAVAQATQQSMPEEVYLVSDVNAFVAQRGGILGFFSKRIMGLGLPLMQTFSVAEFRAVLAHEFGHYHGGDTRLGPFIYRTREAMVRTVRSLVEAQSGILHIPFIWYTNGFMRITQAISRRQEFAADALSAQIVGSAPLITGLKRIHGVGPLYDAYFRTELVPVLGAGYTPPMGEGFQHFISAGPMAEAMEKILASAMSAQDTDPYDTHPPLPERIRALETLGRPTRSRGGDDACAVDLLGDVPAMEASLIRQMVNPELAQRLVQTSWEAVGETVYLPQWRELEKTVGEALAGITPRDLPRGVAEGDALVAALADRAPEAILGERRLPYARYCLGSVLGLRLAEAGYEIQALPGHPVRLCRGDDAIEVHLVWEHLAEGTLTEEAWIAQMANAGILDTPLRGRGGEAQAG